MKVGPLFPPKKIKNKKIIIINTKKKEKIRFFVVAFCLKLFEKIFPYLDCFGI